MSGYAPLLTAAASALEPLTTALRDPRSCQRLLADLGWRVGVSDETLAALGGLLPIADTLARLPSQVEAIASSGAADPVAIAEIADDLAQIAAAIGALADIDAAAIAELPAPLSAPETWADLAAALPDLLLRRYLSRHVPALYGVLRLLGICTEEGRHPTTRTRFRWDAIGEAIASPGSALSQTIGWGGDFQSGALQREIARTLARLGLLVRVAPRQAAVAEALAGAPVEVVTGIETDVTLFHGLTPAGTAMRAGVVFACSDDAGGSLYVGNLCHGDTAQPVQVGAGWTLSLRGELDGSATTGVLVTPQGASVVGGEPALATAVVLAGRPERPWVLLGSPSGTRVELDALTVEIGIGGDITAPEAYLLAHIDDGAFRVVLDLGAADAFLRGVIGDTPPTISGGGELRWDTTSGLHFTGGLGLEVTITIDAAAGPIHVDSLTLALGAGAAGARLAATAGAGLAIGPFSATLAGIGAALDLVPTAAGDSPVALDATLAFIPPTRIGFAVDIAEVVTGGGFVDHDAELGRYTGAVALEFPAVGLGAIVVVDTQLPGDPDGWALFASIYATFPSIALGFGFFLSGVGGIVCLNRTMDAEAIAGGLKSGAVDAILFPDDPLEDAPLIVSQLDAWFPLAEGSCVFGVAATITWGTPVAIVTGEVGFMVSFPDIEIAVLGSLSMALPTEDEALIELHMDTIGVVDVSEGTVLVAASLYDSSLLQTISLSGDMAMYARMKGAPYFLLSVGGYHPDFQPPGGLPASVTDLRRMRAEVAISEDIWYALEAYVALTSNTVQFGSQAELEASAKFLLTTYTARGSVGFDVLLVFSPFTFSADFHAAVGVTAGNGDKELIGVSLAAHLEGPKPWFATGVASFDFFGIDVSFDVSFGGSAAPQAPPRANVLELVAAALDDPGAWRAEAGSAPSPVLLAQEDSEDLWVRPDGMLVVAQTLAPLDRTLQVYGTYAIDGPTRLGIAGAGIDGIDDVDWAPVTDWFAPALYDEMTRAQKLEASSYEEMSAGVSVASRTAAIRAADATSVTPDYEVRIIDRDETRPVTKPQPLAVAFAAATAGLALGRRPTTRTVTSPRFAAGPTTWQSADATTGQARDEAGTYRHALAVQSRAVAADPTARATQRMAPSHAVVGA